VNATDASGSKNPQPYAAATRIFCRFPASRRAALRGYSLVELSIVLAILGLIIGGIVAGQALLRAAELRAVSTEYTRYRTALQAFGDKYNAAPGDMANATNYWGIATACGGTSATGTCNGNGDGFLNAAASASTTGEEFQFWRQLALSGFIGGNYTGVSGPAGAGDAVLSTNVPVSRLTNAGWDAHYIGVYAGDTAAFAGDYGNVFVLGGQSTGNWPMNPVLKPEEAWNIDTKLDDGMPATGRIVSWQWQSCSTAASNTDITGKYKFANSAINCTLFFTKAY
jgi:prepilin-type N-terminal cleavage/methylation domain-containing protein